MFYGHHDGETLSISQPNPNETLARVRLKDTK